MPFCTKCGSRIEDQARFCGRCGAQVTGAPPVIPNAPNRNDTEKVLAALPMWQSKSLGRRDSFAAVITDQRLIVAQITKQVMNQAVNDARMQAKAQGKGYWGQVSGQMAAWSSGYSDRFITMRPDDILVETPGNFVIRNEQLVEVQVRYNAGSDEDPAYYDVAFVSTGGGFQYQMGDSTNLVQALARYYPGKFKAPNGLPKGITIYF